MSRFYKLISLSCLGCLLWACGGGAPDSEDELGHHQKEEESYELVFLDRPAAESDEAVQVSGRERPAEERVIGRQAQPVEQVGDHRREAPVEKVPPETAIATSGQPVVFEPLGEFTVQVGSYQDAKVAAKAASELRDEGYPAYTIASPDKGVRVRIGYFKTHADAQRFGAIFKADRGLEFWVDRRADEK